MEPSRGPKPVTITLSARQRALLEEMSRSRNRGHGEVIRAQIILHAAAGHGNQAIGRTVGVHVETVSLWRSRWAMASERLAALEAQATAAELGAALGAVLADAPRPGRPAIFSPEQLVQLMAVACEAPDLSHRPVTHWTPTELAAEVIQRGIVSTISPRTVGRFLKRWGAPATSEALLAQP